MARFSFRKRASEDDEVPPEGDLDMTPPEDLPEVPEGSDEGGGRSRRILIIVGLGIILLGGFYVANQLFLAPPPPPPTPVRQTVPTPPTKAPAPASAPAPAAPAKSAAPAPPAQTKAPTAAATPPAKSEAKATIPAPPAVPTAPGPVKTEASKAPEAGKAPTPAPPASKAAAKPAPAAAGYSLQVAAMVVEENAQGLKQKLDQGGFQSVIRKATAFVTKHVVTVGDPTGKSEAEELGRRLTVDGFPSQLLAIGDKYSPQIGAFYNLDDAIDLARELQKKNYRPKITSKPANTVVFQVRHGKFDSRSAALKRGGELKAKGFNFLVVRD